MATADTTIRLPDVTCLWKKPANEIRASGAYRRTSAYADARLLCKRVHAGGRSADGSLGATLSRWNEAVTAPCEAFRGTRRAIGRGTPTYF